MQVLKIPSKISYAMIFALFKVIVYEIFNSLQYDMGEIF